MACSRLKVELGIAIPSVYSSDSRYGNRELQALCKAAQLLVGSADVLRQRLAANS